MWPSAYMEKTARILFRRAPSRARTRCYEKDEGTDFNSAPSHAKASAANYQMSFKPNCIERFAPVPRTGLGDAWSGVLQPHPKVPDAVGSLKPAPAGPVGL